MPQIVQQTVVDRPINPAIPLIENGTAVSTTVNWFKLSGRYPFTVTVEGTFVATVRLHVANSPSTPGASVFSDRPQLGDAGVDFTAPGYTSFNVPFQWLCARITAYTSGGVYVYANAG